MRTAILLFKGGLNAWQPLGITAMAGDTVLVYGQPVQEDWRQHESAPYSDLSITGNPAHGRTRSTFKAGINEINYPQITALDVEQGGQLTSNIPVIRIRRPISVRVSGGNHIPTLDITRASDSNAKSPGDEVCGRSGGQHSGFGSRPCRTIKKAHDGDWSAARKTVFWAPRIS